MPNLIRVCDPLPTPVDYAMSALLTVDRKFDHVHFDLFSRPRTIFAICFLIQNLDMPGDEISRPIHVIFMDIILLNGLKPCAVISKTACKTREN